MTDAPAAMVLECPTCGETRHRVLRGKIVGKGEIVFEGVVKCLQCGQVRQATLREEKPIQVPMILSWRERTERTTTEMDPRDPVRVGDKLLLEAGRVLVTAIDTAGGRAEESKASAITTLWAKRADKAVVHFTVNKGRRTVAYEITAAPDEEFFVGDIVDVGKERVVVQSIKVEGRTLKQGSATAEEIVRVYGKAVRERF